MTEEEDFCLFYLVLLNLNVNLKSYTWLVATMLDSAAIEPMIIISSRALSNFMERET